IDAATLQQQLDRHTEAMLGLYGYGAKGLTLAMVQTAIDASDARIDSSAIARILALGRNILQHPVQLLPGMRATVKAVAAEYRTVLITKGDLLHQQRKIRHSGLADLFEHIAIVADKRTADYEQVLEECRATANGFAMIGNSLRSDIEPVLQLGGCGVHVPYPISWAHERRHSVAERHPRLATATTADAIAPALATLAARQR